MLVNQSNAIIETVTCTCRVVNHRTVVKCVSQMLTSQVLIGRCLFTRCEVIAYVQVTCKFCLGWLWGYSPRHSSESIRLCRSLKARHSGESIRLCRSLKARHSSESICLCRSLKAIFHHPLLSCHLVRMDLITCHLN